MGEGVAYSTTEAAHLLNVRAEGMSAWAGEPDHFAKHFEAEGGDARGFAQRRLFGAILARCLTRPLQAAGRSSSMRRRSAPRATATAGESGFDDGSAIEADALVLAIGNQEPEALRAFAGAGRRFIGNPWGDEARAAVAGSRREVVERRCSSEPA